jgi:hypothetical protein
MFVDANQSYSHSFTVRLTVYQTSRLDLEPLMGLTAKQHAIILPPRHTSHTFSLQYRSVEKLWCLKTLLQHEHSRLYSGVNKAIA